MAETQDGGTVIGADTVIKGEMQSDNPATIFGRFEGSIVSKGQVTIAEKAFCQADVKAKIVQVDGGLEGNIIAAEKVQLNATAKMSGDICAVKLHIAEGASVDGHFKIGPDAAKGVGKSGKASATVEVHTKATRVVEASGQPVKK